MLGLEVEGRKCLIVAIVSMCNVAERSSLSVQEWAQRVQCCSVSQRLYNLEA